MSVTPSSTIVGVFRDQAAAEQAVNALYNAGFGQEEIQYMVPGTSGSFFEGLKNFLTGTNDGGANLANDLTNMGLSDTEARYYANEYNNGNPILIVKAAERGTEALNVLRQYGAYNTQTEPAYSGETAEGTQQPVDYAQPGSYTTDTQHPGDYSQYGTYTDSAQYTNVRDLETQSQTPTGEEQPFAAPQPDNSAPEAAVAPHDNEDYQATQATTVTPEHDTGDQNVQSMPGGGDYQTAQATNVTSEHDTTDQSVQSMPTGYETTAAPQDVQPGVAVPGTDTTDQATQADTTTPEQAYSSRAASPAITGNDAQPQQMMQSAPVTADQETEVQPVQASPASPEQTDELQQLQTQLQTLQQQLQEAKARLSAAKEQEDQLKTARERQQQLQEARQQLQDAQAELQATLAELEEVQSRIAQYQ